MNLYRSASENFKYVWNDKSRFDESRRGLHEPVFCEIRALFTVAELLESFRLRHDIYRALGYVRDHSSGLEIDEYDSSSIAFGAFDPVSRALIGTVRLITTEPRPDSQRLVRRIVAEIDDAELTQLVLGPRPRLLPSIVSDETSRQIAAFNREGFAVYELSRIIVCTSHRGSGVSRGLMEFGIAHAARLAPAVIVSSCLPEHLPMNARYGYQKLPGTELFQFDRVGQIANAIVCRTDALPQPTRGHVDELRSSMASGATELTLEIGRDSRALYRFAAPRRARRRTFETAGYCMDQHLIDIFELEASLLDTTLRNHPLLRSLFTRNFRGVDLGVLTQAYLQLLKLKMDYVQYTVPALRASGQVLRDGDEEDRRWSELLLEYAEGETDEDGGYGHHLWARDDMAALGASPELLDAPAHASAVLYGTYFVDDVGRHPYAILGAKGVLEHFSLRVADDVVRGILESGIPNAENAVRFFRHHGVLDIEHVREGDRNLAKLEHPQKRFQILQGAHFASGTYRSLVYYLLPSELTCGGTAAGPAVSRAGGSPSVRP